LAKVVNEGKPKAKNGKKKISIKMSKKGKNDLNKKKNKTPKESTNRNIDISKKNKLKMRGSSR